MKGKTTTIDRECNLYSSKRHRGAEEFPTLFWLTMLGSCCGLCTGVFVIDVGFVLNLRSSST